MTRRKEPGAASYERDIRSKVEADHRGKLILIEIESGDYEIDSHALAATGRVAARHPDGAGSLVRIGSTAAYHLLGSEMFGAP